MSDLTRPVIGITKPIKKDNWAYAAVAAAVRIGGGNPVALTPSEQRKRPLINGVLFGGGQDIFPMLYDQTPKQGYIYDRNRDALEINLAKQARRDDIPALGICRGAQMMNVVRGGALYADVSAEYENAAYPNGLMGKVLFRKTIEIQSGSLLNAAFNTTDTSVNSLHKQAIKRLGDGLCITAKEKNGVIQAIEDPDMHYFMGVQFHPELLIYRSDMRELFRQFVKTSSAQEPVEVLGPDEVA
ncbi:gamma-glutamyl-gamma-aminobutyrate hydrolase family protein [Hyphococcus lacteus]|uniref:Type 1 glutamine amidotransferase n=1 Tax=Hyphococcus lacteus TaxID=3143536 RepID=A0ABV3Z3M9_9PROT